MRSPDSDDTEDKEIPAQPAAARQSFSNRAKDEPRAPKSILKPAKLNDSLMQSEDDSQSLPLPPRLSRGVKDRLAADDAEIAALEKALGLKGKKKLPKSFEDDGLDSLLADLDDAPGEGGKGGGKRRRTEEDDWLQRKRRKAREVIANGQNSELDVEYSESGEVDQVVENDVESLSEGPKEERSSEADAESEVDSFGALDSDSESAGLPMRRIRENPYIAPSVHSSAASSGKYIPPSLRETNTSEKQDLSRLRRQVQGLLNRLSEANLIAILGDTENLYRDHPRQHISSTLIDLLLGLLSDPANLQDTFVILHAGFIAAIYKVIGTDFGAQVVQRIVEEFDKFYALQIDGEASRKELTNLISLLADLYNFQVVGSSLVYDFIRIFLKDLSENNTELLLKIIRSKSPVCCPD